MPQPPARLRTLTSLLIATAFATCTIVGATPRASMAADPTPLGELVMTGLDNPRGLAFGPEGALYVAEAGRGGDTPCAMKLGLLACGPSGAVSRLWHGEQTRIATGFPSAVNAAGVAQAGPTDISLLGRGGAYVTIGLRDDPANRANLASLGAGFGQLVHVAASGEWRYVADVAAFEAASNSDAGEVDSNPYALLAEPGRQVVVDSGANALLAVDADGAVSLLAPPFPTVVAFESVPTSLTVGPDGAYYVGELTGFPFLAGIADVYRVVPGMPPEPRWGGFKTIMDIAFDAAGNLYVLQHSDPARNGLVAGAGVVTCVHPDGTRETLVGGLTRPTSLAIGPDGALYVTNIGTSISVGEVRRFAPCPGTQAVTS